MKYEINARVRVHWPKSEYHGLEATVLEIDDTTPSLPYRLELDKHKDTAVRIPFWLPENRIRPLKPKTVADVIPGDVIADPNGVVYTVMEPTVELVFLSQENMPGMVQYVPLENLKAMGFKLVDKDDRTPDQPVMKER